MGRRIGDYDQDYVENQTPWKLLIKIAAGVFVVVMVLCAGNWLFGWFKTGADVIGPGNVTKQWEFAYTYHESLKQIANNWCTMKKAEDAETDREVKPQRVSQRLAVETQYRTVQAQYDAALDNAFKAKLVAPPDVPRRAPTLEQTVAETGCMG